MSTVVKRKGHLPRAIQPSWYLTYLQKVPTPPLMQKGTLDNCTHRILPSIKTNFTVSLQICLTVYFQLALNLTPKPLPTRASKIFPFATNGNATRPSTSCVASILFRQVKLSVESWGSHTFLQSMVLQKGQDQVSGMSMSNISHPLFLLTHLVFLNSTVLHQASL